MDKTEIWLSAAGVGVSILAIWYAHRDSSAQAAVAGQAPAAPIQLPSLNFGSSDSGGFAGFGTNGATNSAGGNGITPVSINQPAAIPFPSLSGSQGSGSNNPTASTQPNYSGLDDFTRGLANLVNISNSVTDLNNNLAGSPGYENIQFNSQNGAFQANPLKDVNTGNYNQGPGAPPPTVTAVSLLPTTATAVSQPQNFQAPPTSVQAQNFITATAVSQPQNFQAPPSTVNAQPILGAPNPNGVTRSPFVSAQAANPFAGADPFAAANAYQTAHTATAVEQPQNFQGPPATAQAVSLK